MSDICTESNGDIKRNLSKCDPIIHLSTDLENPSVLFTLMSYMDNEYEYLPWVITIRNMEDIHDHLIYQPEYFELKVVEDFNLYTTLTI